MTRLQGIRTISGGRVSALAVALAGGLLLSACGLKGDLKTPPPMWGNKDRAAVDRNLPKTSARENERIVFTRDDVNLFRPDAVDDDPFDDQPAPGAGGGSQVPLTDVPPAQGSTETPAGAPAQPPAAPGSPE